MKRMALLFSLILLAPTFLCAEIEKKAMPSDSGLQLYWWPKLPLIEGWHQDEGSSYQYGINAQVPDGVTFSDAETVIYAKAIYKPRVPELSSLEQLINDDIAGFKTQDPSIIIKEVPKIISADGKVFKSLAFIPKATGNYEQVSYAEEAEFYLIFAISSRNKEGFEKGFKAYRMFITQYMEKP